MKKIEYFNLNNYTTALQYDAFSAVLIAEFDVNCFIEAIQANVKY